MPSPFDTLPERDWRLYLEDMLEFCGSVKSYVAGHTLDTWSQDAMRLDATLHKPSLIGEAARQVPDPVREQAPDIPWRRIVGLRNRLMHAYPATDRSVVWAVVTSDIPALQDSLERLLGQFPANAGPDAGRG